MTLRVSQYGQQRLSVPTGNNFLEICPDKCLFRFDEMYLGMNRVVNVNGASGRIGGGMCNVCVTWEMKPLC